MFDPNADPDIALEQLWTHLLECPRCRASARSAHELIGRHLDDLPNP